MNNRGGTGGKGSMKGKIYKPWKRDDAPLAINYKGFVICPAQVHTGDYTYKVYRGNDCLFIAASMVGAKSRINRMVGV